MTIPKEDPVLWPRARRCVTFFKKKTVEAWKTFGLVIRFAEPNVGCPYQKLGAH
jgi:hypothetical protein